MPGLFDTLQVGELRVPNRVWMAPLTRLWGTEENIPTELMVEYYRQRVGAGLIICEATPVTPFGVGSSGSLQR